MNRRERKGQRESGGMKRKKTSKKSRKVIRKGKWRGKGGKRKKIKQMSRNRKLYNIFKIASSSLYAAY